MRTVARRIHITPTHRQIDMLGVVYNGEYQIWFEQGMLAIIKGFLPWNEIQSNKLAFMVIENKTRFCNYAIFNDELVLTSTHKIMEIYEGKFVFSHSIVRKKSKMSIAEGYNHCVLVNWDTKHLIREIPADLWERYQNLK